MANKTCRKCRTSYELNHLDEDDTTGLCHQCWREETKMLRRRAQAQAEQMDYGGVLGADGQIHSDADPGL